MIALSVLLLAAAFVLFVIEGWLRRSLVAAGLACWVLAELLRAGLVHAG